MRGQQTESREECATASAGRSRLVQFPRPGVGAIVPKMESHVAQITQSKFQRSQKRSSN